MSEKLPEGWVCYGHSWDKRFGEDVSMPCGHIELFNGEFYPQYQQLEFGQWEEQLDCMAYAHPDSTLDDAICKVEAAHVRAERAEQLRLRREAAQLLDGDFAAALVGEKSAG